MSLRDYQIDVVERSRARIAQGVRRLIIQAPTGGGKSHVTSEIIRRAVARGRRCLFLAHRRRLISQKCRRLDEFGVPYGVLMSGERPCLSAPVQVASKDTLLSRAVRNDWVQPPPADVVVVDEAHNCVQGEYRALLEMYGDAVIIGATATPARADGRGMAPYFQAIECTVPVSRLIREGWLVPVRCYAPQNFGRRCVSKRKLCGDPVAMWKALAGGRPTVLFAGKVEASLAACAAFNAAGVPAEHIDAETPDADREAVIARVEAGITQVLCNVNVLTEGVDVPCLSCCVLFRMAGSYVLFAQAVGRVMRAHPGKADAVLLDHSDAVLEHGFPDEDVRWELTESESVDERNKKDREEGKRSRPIICPSCGLAYAGSVVCPSCGYKLPRRLQPTAVRNQLLTEVEKTLTPEQLRESRVRYWRTCLATMAAKGMTLGAASQMYRSRYKEWPPNDFPDAPHKSQCWQKVADALPQYARRDRA